MNNTNKTNKIRCVILGLGNQASEHMMASIDHADVEIIAAIDTDTSKWQQFAQSPMQLVFFVDLKALKAANIDFDAFILALPHDVYANIWDDLVSFGKPLLKEKPLGRDYAEAKHFMEQAKLHGCGLQTAIQRRMHPSYAFLAQYIKENNHQITELHSHLHLGKSTKKPAAVDHVSDTKNWRADKAVSGGGALLDSGYHLIDLVLYLVGDFDLISATMWHGNVADNGKDIEDRCWLMGVSRYTWIMVDTWVEGEKDAQGKLQKSEGVILQLKNGDSLTANREQVQHNDKVIFETNRDWEKAMQSQLTDFANNVRNSTWQSKIIWDQLPAIRKIEEAYRLSSRY